MQTVYEALTEGHRTDHMRRTGSRVHRDSRTRPGDEGPFWRPFNPKESARIMQAAERYDRVQRLADRRDRNRRKNGHLGHIALDVLRELLRLIDYKTGRLDPAIKTLAGRIGRSPAAVVDALKRLRLHGFLDWMRRHVRTGNAGLRGPQVRQTSNAYRLSLPGELARLMPPLPPAPDDDTHRRETATAEARLMIDRLPLDEQPAELVADPGLAAVLSRLARSLMKKERDSANQHESRPHDSILRAALES